MNLLNVGDDLKKKVSNTKIAVSLKMAIEKNIPRKLVTLAMFGFATFYPMVASPIKSYANQATVQSVEEVKYPVYSEERWIEFLKMKENFDKRVIFEQTRNYTGFTEEEVKMYNQKLYDSHLEAEGIENLSEATNEQKYKAYKRIVNDYDKRYIPWFNREFPGFDKQEMQVFNDRIDKEIQLAEEQRYKDKHKNDKLDPYFDVAIVGGALLYFFSKRKK